MFMFFRMWLVLDTQKESKNYTNGKDKESKYKFK